MKFANSHEWVKIEDDLAIVGISDHAQQELSDVVYVDFPETGTTVEIGESFMSIESVKAASDIYAPMAGEIVEVNETLQDQPELVNESPQDKAWLVKIKFSDIASYDKLMESEAYLESIQA